MSPEEFRRQYPGHFFLDPRDLPGLRAYLARAGFLAEDEPIAATEKAGEGNMNCTLRVTTDHRRFIIKQARPWVEKYPQFAAPWDRACRELEFYQLASRVPSVAAAMPRLLHGDATARMLVLEDLGSGGDGTSLYAGDTMAPAELDALADYLTALHGAFVAAVPRPELPNREMRALNHAHVFVIPLAADNGLDLGPFQSAADELKADVAFGREVARLGQEVYLSDGPCLLHGDFFPGSIIRTPAGPRVIDPEFCFFGRPEYDLGVLLAHLHLANQPSALGERLRQRYQAAVPLDDALMRQLSGVEIMRRLIGYAQLPLRGDLARKQDLLALSREMVLS